MTSQKSFKARVRDRMGKTGESYTAARKQLIDKTAQPDQPEQPTQPDLASQPNQAPPADQTPPLVRAGQTSEASVLARTGRTWNEWFSLLDAWGAIDRPHPEIARWIVEEHGVTGWSAQSITVAYEQARGRRAAGQGADGRYRINASRTVAAPVDRLYAAFTDPELRARWLPEELRIRTATAPRSMRADWPDGASRIVVAFTAKDDGRTQLALSHERLPDADAAAQVKKGWRERLDALKELLEG